MRIAQNIKGYNTHAAQDLQQNIANIIAQETIVSVIETGTFHGLGTTQAVLQGMSWHGFEFRFISIEVNPEYVKIAKANTLGSDKGFEIWNGLSLPHPKQPIDTTFNVPDHVIVDHLPKDRSILYHKEINFNVSDDLLKKAIIEMDSKPEMVILDSAGHMGLIEFKYLMELLESHSFWLILDDISHVKHYESMNIIYANPNRFKVIWESEENQDHRSAIIMVQ